MQEHYNVFYCTVCNVCKSLPNCPKAVKFCSGCKLVQYCGSHHQKIDWHGHKDFCKSIQHIQQRTGTDHVFKEAFEFAEEDNVQWNNLRIHVMNLVELILKRPLTTVESQTLFFPPVCNFCFTYKPNKMFSCSSCDSVLYCCREHQNSDQKHLDNCQLLALSFKIDISRFSGQLSCLSSLITNLKLPNELLQSTELFLKQGSASLSHKEVFLSQPLSYSLTLAFAVSKVAKVSRSKLTIHVVGADTMEVQAILTFDILFRLLNSTHLKIIFIGPCLPNDIHLPPEIKEVCSLLVINDKLYHEYVSSDTYLRPDVIVVYNCGFCEFKDVPERDIWRSTLPYILNATDCLVVLTSYTIEESKQDFNRVCEASSMQNHNVLLRNVVNPFCSLYPLRNWEAGHEAVFYVNKYISVLQTYI